MCKNANEILKDFEMVSRQMIDRETEIVNQRIRWAFFMQSALLAAYWNVINSSVVNRDVYISLIIFTGVFFSVSTVYSVWTSERAIAFILKKWDECLNTNKQLSDSFPLVWAGGSAVNNTHGVESHFKKYLYKHLFYHIGCMSMYKVIPCLFFIIWFCITILFCSHVLSNIYLH